MTVAALAVLALLLPMVLFDFLFRPTIRRLGLRNVVRRRSEASLVIGGSMLATALITASFVIGTSFDHSIRAIASDRLGPIDEIVFVDDGDDGDDGEDVAALASAVEADASGQIDGVLPFRMAQVAVGSGSEVGRNVEPRVAVYEFDLARAATFGGDPDTTGVAGLESGSPGTATLNQDMADALDVEAGDAIELFFGTASIRFSVDRVIDVRGLAGIAEIIVPPGSIDVATVAAGTSSDGVERSTIAPSGLFVSNSGGVFEGAGGSDDVEQIILAEADRLGATVSVDQTKARLLDAAESEGTEMTELFGTIGGFSVIAGILLVINLFVMLAGERIVELGTMRAVGVKRGTILRSFALEGAVYGIVAAAIGALLGIVVAQGVVILAAGVVADSSMDVVLSIDLIDLVSGAAIGLAISQLTVLFTSLRLTKIDVVAALKDLAPRPSSGHRLRRTVSSLVGIAAGTALFVVAPDNGLAAMAGPVIAAVSAIGVLGLVVPRTLATIIGCSVAIVWPVLVFSVRSEVLDDAEVGVFLLQGVLLVGLATVLLASLDRVWLGLAARLTPSGLGSRLGLAHALARPVRSALLVAMYALVIFTVTFIAVVVSAFSASAPQLAQQAGGGYDVVVDSNPTAPLDAQQLRQLDSVEIVSSIRRGLAETGPEDDARVWGLSGVDESWDATLAPLAEDLAPQFASSVEAWEAVVRSGEWMMAPEDEGFRGGETVELRGPSGGTATVVVAGVARNGWLVDSSIFVSDELSETLWGNVGPATRHYVATAGDDVAVADVIQSRWPEQGAEAVSFRERADEVLADQKAFFQMLQAYLGLGLLIGIAGLGVVLVRSVRERRRELGMLAAIGVPIGQTQRAFLVEASFIGGQGVLLGVGLGMVSAWQVVSGTATFEEGLTFDIPVRFLIGLTVVAVVASMLAALAPARRASHVPPAVALRVTG